MTPLGGLCLRPPLFSTTRSALNSSEMIGGGAGDNGLKKLGVSMQELLVLPPEAGSKVMVRVAMHGLMFAGRKLYVTRIGQPCPKKKQ